VLLCCNPRLQFARGNRPDVVIALDTGPEVLTGSTRLKAGTGTKLVLNVLSTLAMVRIGKVVGNLMVDLNPSNSKLRDRAVRIVRALTGAGDEAARRALVQSGWVVKQALRRRRRG
jgi:N-acetylmuramic acid 6-phosphate (MurNAc-6-P) etherase